MSSLQTQRMFLAASTSALPCSSSSATTSRHIRTFTKLAVGGARVQTASFNSFFRSQHRLSQHRRSLHASAPRAAAAKNPYSVLGVKDDAGSGDIKRAYYQLAKQYHPDTNKDKGAHERFVEIQTAYDLLSDPKKKDAYDRYGAASQQEGFDPEAFSQHFGGAGGFSGFQDLGAAFAGAGGRGNAGDLFETLFSGAFGGVRGGGRTQSGFGQNHRGEDIETTIGISFLDACRGVKRSITTEPVADCRTCTGTGLKSGAKRAACGACGGTGTRTYVIQSGFQMASTCQACQGAGTTVPRGSQCGDCAGLGKVKLRKTVEVNIPAGVEDGMSVRIAGAGDAPISGKGTLGDLHVRVNVASSKVFRRQGANLYHDARIPVHIALLGGRVRVPTLDGDVEVRVPAGTQHGEECVLKDRGVPLLRGSGRGDMYVAFAVQLPRSLSTRQRAILQQYADEVDGRSTTTVGSAAAEESERDDKPGTSIFTSSPSWLSRVWDKIRGLARV